MANAATQPTHEEAAWFRGPVRGESVGKLGRVAAANLLHSHQTIPAVTHHDRAAVGALEEFRRSLRAEAEERGTKLTGLAFHVKILARALEDFPLFNTALSADGTTLWYREYCDIGLAVDTPQGLLVPVLRDADRKGVWEIAAEILALSAQAREGRLPGTAMGQASMTISNLGGIGGTAFSPIVNPPEVAILGITRAGIEPVWDGAAFQPVERVPLDLTYDHRVINGADAARFLRHYCTLVEDPLSVLTAAPVR